MIEGIWSSGCRARRDAIVGGRTSPERPGRGRAVRRSGIRCSGRMELREREIRPGREEEGQDTRAARAVLAQERDAWPVRWSGGAAAWRARARALARAPLKKKMGSLTSGAHR